MLNIPRFHPGEFLKDDLEVLDLTIEEFAEKSDIPVKTLQGIIDLKLDIDEDTANKLAAYFDCSPECWLRAQEAYNKYIKKV